MVAFESRGSDMQSDDGQIVFAFGDEKAAIIALLNGRSSAEHAYFFRKADPEKVEDAIKELACMPTLVAKVKSSDPEEQMQALGAVEVLAACSEQVSWRVCGVLESIVAALGAGGADLVLAAVRCLRGLSKHAEMTEHFVSQGLLEPLKRLLAVGSEEIIYHTLLLLGKIAIDSEQSRLIMCEKKVLRSLTHTLLCRYYTAETKQLVIRAAFNVAKICDIKDSASASFASIVTKIAACSEHEHVQKEGVWCIHLLSEQVDDMKQRLGEITGLSSALYTAVQSAPDAETRDVAQATLESLGIDMIDAEASLNVSTGLPAGGDDDDWLAGIAQKQRQQEKPVMGSGASNKTKKKRNKKKKKGKQSQ
jgi:hypothetical protein